MEFAAILRYLRLSLWPASLCLDYGDSIDPSPPLVLFGAVGVGLLALGTVWGLLRGRKWGFLGAWFLVILAPTSSVVPLRDPIFEHRMYLPLAAVVSAVGLGGFGLWRKWTQKKPWFRDQPVAAQWAAPGIAVAAVAVALGAMTIARNSVYQTSLAIWQDTVDKSPKNARAQTSLGNALCEDSRDSLGMERLREAIRLAPQDEQTHNNLGGELAKQGRIEEAIEQFRFAIRIAPGNIDLHRNLGLALFHLGKLDMAIEEFREAIRIYPQDDESHNSLGAALGQQGKFEEAVGEFREAVRLNPQFTLAYANLALALDKLGRHDEAAEARIHADTLNSILEQR
jgi:tetratricopeptide (TPR) repeat protein